MDDFWKQVQAAADQLKIKSATFYQWRQRGIPHCHHVKIHKITGIPFEALEKTRLDNLRANRKAAP